jgi:hypothetical protein
MESNNPITPEEKSLLKYPVKMTTESLLGNIHTFDNNKWDREIYLQGLIDAQSLIPDLENYIQCLHSLLKEFVTRHSVGGAEAERWWLSYCKVHKIRIDTNVK